MTVKERTTLNILKKEVLYSLELEKVSDIELYKFLNDYNYYLDDLDISTMSQSDKEILFDEVDEYLYEKENSNKLDRLLEYIQEKDYELDHLLYFTNYTEDDLDTSMLSANEITYIADELETSISEYEYQIELKNLEEQVSAIDEQQKELKDLAHEFNIDTDDVSTQNNQLNQLLEDKEKLLQEIKALKENHKQVNKEALIKELQVSSAIQKCTRTQYKYVPLRNTYLTEISNNPASLFCFNL